MQISLIVPLEEKEGAIQELSRYVNGCAASPCVKEIIFIRTNGGHALPPYLGNAPKVKTLLFSGTTKADCLEAGAFEATGDILFFLKPGNFPGPQFDQLILASLQNNTKAGVLVQPDRGSLWRKIMAKLPLRCALCFITVNNFFTSRQAFHLRSRQDTTRKYGTFRQVLHQYAVSFRATLV
ncbi:hypothetical protein I0P70_19750 [Pontibacter sp. FD36]|uniref:hypothetical protein n=1 Tax=Pontibacter sp. FD36 TaxID=2789860 RepID=UPI0018A92B9A|nr:hypothetical protein [Pontibacter sp. FD36]MBF8965494.1 hypothetical protein [Pontibacter sp. FD36]